ncbi:hypothetical protein [Crocosphaera sp. XPORK-15E]|uniref:hypothetical protein n=1 Tax=Crocosphaera sp. XPORK-15E TaxID=3110247 RepID=UPI002B212725|nr:hypothetical protein [Crocosphaera sp. XPORK-15E]MEA5535276.1 hypothetical protein [Crocosphaera sp. XPORK-15E]
MIKDEARIKLTDNYGKKQVILPEHQGQYKITIRDIPENTIVIDPEKFESPKTIFKGNKGECKRADYIIISNENTGKFIIIIEMKAGKAIEKDVIKQLKGAECLVYYCKEIGKSFWGHSSFLNGYQYRFVSVKQILVNKKSTREKKEPKIHNHPENMLKIAYQNTFVFNKLIGKLP